jgi:hypothetical protein
MLRTRLVAGSRMIRGAERDDSIQTAAVPDCALMSIVYHHLHVSERREFCAIAADDNRMMCGLYHELDHLGLGIL